MKRKFKKLQITMGAEETTASNNITLDSGYNRLKAISIFTNTSFSSNANHKLSSGINIKGKEVLPREFDTALLFPKSDNDEFRKLNYPIDNDNLELAFERIGSTGAAVTFTIVLEITQEKNQDNE